MGWFPKGRLGGGSKGFIVRLVPSPVSEGNHPEGKRAVDLFYAPLVPIILAFLGAVVVLVVARWGRPWALRLVAWTTITGVWLALLNGGEACVSFPSWRPGFLFGIEPTYCLSDFPFPFVVLLAMTGSLLVIVLSGVERSGPLLALVFISLGAALCFTLAANVLTMYMGWLLFDLVWLVAPLALGRRVLSLRSVWLGYIMGLMILGVVLSLEPKGFAARWSALTPAAAFILALGAMVRVELPPPELRIHPPEQEGAISQTLFSLFTLTMGFYLMERVLALAGEPLLGREMLIALGGLAFLVNALLAWVEGERGGLFFLVPALGAGAILAGLSVTPSVAALLLPSLNLVLSLGVLALMSRAALSAEEAGFLEKALRFSMRWTPSLSEHLRGLTGLRARFSLLRRWLEARRTGQVVIGVALASLAGAPFTLGFWSYASLYQGFLLGNFWLRLSCLVAYALLLAALGQWAVAWCKETARGEAGWVLLALLLALLLLVGGLFPSLLLRWSGVSDSLWPLNRGQLGFQVLGLLMGGLFFLYRRRVFGHLAAFWGILSRGLRGEVPDSTRRWLTRKLEDVVEWTVELWEGEGYLAWVILVLALVWLTALFRRR